MRDPTTWPTGTEGQSVRYMEKSIKGKSVKVILVERCLAFPNSEFPFMPHD